MVTKLPRDTRILLVDDEPDFRNALAFTFKRKGYQVCFASNGKEAFDLIQLNPVDVVISDILMPGGDGVEFLVRTRRQHIETPIILLVTGFSELSTEEAHTRGADALFGKPLDRKVLEETVLRLLLPLEERRSLASKRVNHLSNVKLEFQNIDRTIVAQVVNLGLGGMGVSLPLERYPDVNDLVSFKISLDDSGDVLDGSGIIRWMEIIERNTACLPANCGIEFTYLGESQRRKVAEYSNA